MKKIALLLCCAILIAFGFISSDTVLAEPTTYTFGVQNPEDPLVSLFPPALLNKQGINNFYFYYSLQHNVDGKIDLSTLKECTYAVNKNSYGLKTMVPAAEDVNNYLDVTWPSLYGTAAKQFWWKISNLGLTCPAGNMSAVVAFKAPQAGTYDIAAEAYGGAKDDQGSVADLADGVSLAVLTKSDKLWNKNTERNICSYENPYVISEKSLTLAKDEMIYFISDPNETFENDQAHWFITITLASQGGSTVEKSNNCYLKSLEIGDLTLSPSFDKNTTEYNANAEDTLNSIKINAVAEDSKAEVQISGGDTLVTGDNLKVITVTAQDGSTKKYNIHIKKAEKAALPSENRLKALEACSQSVKLIDGTYDYSIYVENSVTKATVTAAPVDAKAVVKVSAGTSLDVGDNIKTITITAQDGSKADYSLHIIRAEKPSENEVYLKTITAAGQLVTVVKGTFNYSVNVDASVTEANLTAAAEDSQASVKVTGNNTLQTGENEFSIKVTSSGKTTEYQVTINKAEPVKSNDSSLKELSIKSIDGLGFVTGTTSYNITVPADINTLEVTAVPTDTGAAVAITGADDIAAGNNTITITVIAPDGSQTDYVINVTKETAASPAASSDATPTAVPSAPSDVSPTAAPTTTEVPAAQASASDNEPQITTAPGTSNSTGKSSWPVYALIAAGILILGVASYFFISKKKK